MTLFRAFITGRPAFAGSLLLFICSFAQAAELVRHQRLANGVVLHRDDGVTVTVSALTSGSVEVLYRQADEQPLPSLAVPDKNRPEQAKIEISQAADGLNILLPGISVEVQAQPFKLTFSQDGRALIEEAAGGFFYQTVRGVQFALTADEKLYGGGQRVLGMDRRGSRMPLYNRASYGYSEGPVDQMYFGLPAVMSSRNYAILFDNTASGHLDMGHTSPNRLQFDAVGGRLSYIVVAAPALPALVKQVVSLTGRQPLPPRWALGNFASRFGYRTEQETRDVVTMFNEQGIPLDAVVLDLYWFGPDIQGHMGNLDWDKNAFPTPQAMISDFAEQDIRTVVITEPFVLTSSSEYQSAKANQALAKGLDGNPHTFDFYFGNTGLVDVFNDKGRDWFWQYYQRLLDQGISGWWGDLGEPEVHPYDALHSWDGTTVTADEIHNGFGHQWAKMVYERTLRAQPEQRPFVLMRSGFLGSQRYGMMPWTGDVSRTWGGFKAQVELALQMSVFGLAYTHSDLGGFAGGDTFNAQLYTRWLQAGTFFPVYRPHAHEGIAPEPVFHDDSTKQIVSRFIQLRYDMLPYNYSLSYTNSLTGMPLMRPMAFANSERFFEEGDQFLWGDAFLVKPITAPDLEHTTVALPAGTWFDFFSGKKYHSESGRNVEHALTLETMPVYVKAGSFVPMQSGLARTADYNAENLTVHYWADASVSQAAYRMYEDQGQSPQALAKQAYLTLDFSASHNTDMLRLNVSPKGSYAGLPDQRKLTWKIHGLSEKPAQMKQLADEKWHWEAKTGVLTVTQPISHATDSSLHIEL